MIDVKKIINLDVDGVLYPILPLEEYKEIGCFLRYAPMYGALKFVEDIREFCARYNYQLYFLTKTCDQAPELHHIHAWEKMQWINDTFGMGTGITRVLNHTQNKSDFSSGILIDDFGRNCMNWDGIDNISIQFGEKKVKPWLNAETYDDVLYLLNQLEAN
jgi:hypothetical protein